jgi:hypothetical protein
MLMHQTLSKGWCHARSGLLLGLLYVLVDDWWKLEHASEPPRAGRPALLSDPEVITLAILAQWPRFRSERDFWRFAHAHLRTYFPNLCSQSQLNRRVRSVEPELRHFQRALARTLRDVSEVYHVLDTTLIPAIVRVRASRQGLFCGQATFGRSASKTEWVYGFKVALSVSPQGVICAFGLAEASSDERPIGEYLINRGLSRCLPGRQGLYGRSVGATLVGSLWSVGSGHSQRQLQEGVGENGPSLGVWKAADHRRGHRPTQGHLRPGAPQGQDASRSFGPLGSQDGGLHLRAAAQRPARTTAAPPGRPNGLSGYASLVLGL